MGDAWMYLDIFTVFVACGFSEEGPHDDAVGIQFSDDGVARHGRETGEDDEFVVLTQVPEEVVYAWSLCHSPTMLSSPLAMHQEILQAQNQSVGSLPCRIRIW